ncbi:uncharacterized protein LOC126744096 [Anthonomus grandis grandis]|uniref:uncharacterized protein LOC126744096 n=1 Tax=Anthonomus grandis grandis TaxID=2921223 RepID=UPI002166319F|nr:uncharacterized protein LOC126744096 [Anthonomus grandis grandis]
MVPVVFLDLYKLDTFIKNKASRILHIKTFDTELEKLRIQSVIKDLNLGEYNHYLDPENQLFLDWYELKLFLEDKSSKTSQWSGLVLVFLDLSHVDPTDPDYSLKLKQLNDYVLTGSFAKVIIISSTNGTEQNLEKYFESLDYYFSENISNTIHYGHLTKKVKTDLLNLPCILKENKLFSLKEFLHIDSVDNPRLRKLFDADMLKTMLTNENQLYSDQNNYGIYSSYPEFYVKRKFVEYRIGTTAIKNLLTNPREFCGLIIISGFNNTSELINLLDASTKDIRKIQKIRHLLVYKTLYHAYRIFNFVKLDVEMIIFLRYCSKKGFTCVNTKGYVNNFKDLFTEKTDFNERDLVQKKLLILSGPAGIGKTSTLIYLCDLLNSRRWAIFVDLSKNPAVKGLPLNLTRESTVDFLWAWTDKKMFTKKLLYDALFGEKSKPVYLLMDEFNRSILRESWLRVLSYLNVFSKAYIWITARPIDVPVLEKTLSVCSTSLTEISDIQQKVYLTNFIKKRLNMTKVDSKFVGNFVEHSQYILTSREDIFGKFLLFKMLIDVNLNFIEEYHKGADHRFFFQTFFDPFEIVEKYICYKEINLRSWEAMQRVIFPQNNFFQFDTCSITVAEYLMAKELYSLMLTTELSLKLIKFLLTECLIKPQYIYVRVFLNVFFREKAVINEDVSSMINKLWIQDSSIFFNENSDWALPVLIKENLFNLASWFLCKEFIKHNAHMISYQKGRGKTVLNLAIDKKNTNICNAILDTYVQKQLIYDTLDNGKQYKGPLRKINKSWVLDTLQTYENTMNEFKQLYSTITLWKTYKHSELFLRWSHNLVHFAAMNRLNDMLEQLIREQISVDGLDTNNATALYYASKEGYIEIVQKLVEAGANVNNQTKKSKTAVLISIQRKLFNIACYLLQLDQTDIFWCDVKGTSYLGQAAKFGSIEIAKLLLARGSDINHRDKLGMSPLSWAVKMGHVHIINFLISQGADCFIRDNIHSNLIHIALKARKWNVVKYLTFWQINVEYGNLYRVTPLQCAVKLRNWAIVKHLVLEGAPIYSDSVSSALKGNQWNLVRIMLQQNADISSFTVDEKNQILEHCLPSGDTHNKISYLMQLGNADLLNTYIINMLFCDVDLESKLSELYEKHLINKSKLSKNIKNFIEEKLYEIRAARGQQIIKINNESLKERLNLICENIREIKQHDENDTPIDDKFISHADVIAQQIEVIAHHDKIKNDCPAFKQTQFCLLLFLNYFREKPQDSVYSFVLNQCKIIEYLNYLLDAIRNYLEQGNFTSQNQSSLKSDFRLVRDIYSLKTIWSQIKTTQDETHPSHDVEVYGLIRCLQVIGENVKNTDEHPNLSDEVHKHLMYYAPTSVQKILTRLRDSIRHPKLLMERIKFEKRILHEKEVYQSVKNDLKKILVDIELILYKKKAEAINIFLKNSDECMCDVKFKKITRHFALVRFNHSYDDEVYIYEEIETTKTSIEKLKQLLKNNINQKNSLKKIENDITQFLEETKTYVKRVKNEYCGTWFDLPTLLNTRNSIYLNTQIRLIEKLATYFNRPALHCSIILFEMMETNKKELQNNPQDQEKIQINNILGNLLYLIQFQMYRAEKLEEIQGTLVISEKETPEEEKISLLDEIFNDIRNNIKNQETVTQFDSFINDTKENHSILTSINKTSNSPDDLIEKLSNKKLKSQLRRQKKRKPQSFTTLVAELNLYGKILKNITNIKKNYYDLLEAIEQYFASIDNAEVSIAVNDFKNDQIKLIANFYKNKFKILDSIVKNGYDLDKPLVRAAMEILLLDILNYLDDRRCIQKYSTSYEEFSPILISTALLNYLAHGNILTDSLPYDPQRSILNCICWLRKHFSLNIIRKQVGVDNKPYLFKENISNKFIKLQGQIIPLPSYHKLYHMFLDAAEVGNIASLKYILDNILYDIKTGASMVQFEGFLWPAIFYASVNGHRTIVLELIGRVDKSHQCSKQSSLLIRLAKQTVARLDVETWNASNNYDNIIALFHQTCLQEAVKSDKQIVEDLLKYCDADTRDCSDNTALIIAAEAGRIDSVGVLLSHAADVNAKNFVSRTALQHAILHGHENIAKLLIDSGANVEDLDGYGLSALAYSITYSSENTVNHLLQYVHVDTICSDNNSTALHVAAENGREDILILLIQKGADVNAINNHGSTALELAISKDHKNIATKLLNLKDIDFNTKNINQHDALYLAAENNMTEIVEILLRNGAQIESFDKNNRTALHTSAENGCITVVELLLDKHANLYATDVSGNTALHLAIYSNQKRVVELLLKRTNDSAFINAININCYTPLHISANYGQHNLVELLIDNGAEFNVKDENNNTALHMAAMEGHDDVVKKLLSIPKIAQHINETNGNQIAPLHLAAYYGFDKTVKCLLEKNAKVDVRGLNDMTPLHCAAQSNHYNIVKILLNAKADVNALTSFKNSAIYFAAANGFERIVKLLLLQNPKPNIDIVDEFNRKPLCAPTEFGFYKIVKLLLSHGAKPNGSNALLAAAMHGHIETVKLLLEYDIIDTVNSECTALFAATQENQTEIASMLIENKSDINFLSKNKFSPLYMASLNGNKEICKKLIESGVNVDLKNENDITALHVAADKGYYTIVTLLLSHGADVNALTVANKSALHFASEKGHRKIVSLLLQKKAQVNAIVDESLLTPLHLAATNGHTATVKLLLSKGADINSITHAQSLALHLASQNGHLKVIMVLLNSFKVNINARDSEKRTSLYLATMFNRRRVVELLISRGADANMSDIHQTTPLHIATVNNYKDLMSFLLKHGSDVNLCTYTHNLSTIHFTEYDNEGHNYVSALHIATYCSDHTTMDILLNHPDITIDIQDINKRTPLHHSVFLNSPVFAEKLLKHGANKNIVDNTLNTPILLSVVLQRESIFKILFDHKADVNLADIELRTPLHYSVTLNNEYITKLLLKRVANINCLDKNKSTCLHIATKNGYLPIVKLLLQYGASVNLTDNALGTPLHYAAKKVDLDIIKIIIARGANVNALNSKWDIPLMLLSNVPNKNTEETAEFMIKYGADINARNINHITSLHVAAAQNNLEMAIVLLRHGADVNIIDTKLHTALHYCAENGNKLIAAYLIQNGIDLNGVTIAQVTALHIGALSGHTGFVDILLRCGAAVNVTDVNRRTPLQYATEAGNKDIVKSLLDRGADVNNRDVDLCTALHKASELGHIEIIKILLKNSAEIDLIDINGYTALHYGVQNHHGEIVEELLSYGAKIDHSNICIKCTSLLNIACSLGHTEIVRTLIRSGVKTAFTDIFGRTALHYATLDGHIHITDILLTQEVDKDAQDYSGQTAIHYAAQNCLVDIIKKLIESGANANLTNAENRTALHYAVESGNVDLVNLLLPVISNINSTDISGETALHIAVAGNHKDIVKRLIEYHADVNFASPTLQVMPIHLATTVGDVELVEILVQNDADVTARDIYGRTPYKIAAEIFGSESEFCQTFFNILLAKIDIEM